MVIVKPPRPLGAVRGRGTPNLLERLRMPNHFKQTIRICSYCSTAFSRPPCDPARCCSRQCRDLFYKAPLDQRFMRFIQKSNDCWLWTGAIDRGGRGVFQLGRTSGGTQRAHRIAWILASGETLSVSDVVLHTCDNPRCVRNDGEGIYVIGAHSLPRFGHLAKGTLSNNAADMWAKDRGPRQRRHH
jgi:hypothetical protein